MPKISERAVVTQDSPIRSLVPYANEAKAKGVEVLHLNIGQPDIATPTEMLATFKAYDNPILSYTASAGTLEYRKVLQAYYAKHQVDVTTDEIIVTNGGSEALQFAIWATLDPDDEIIIPEPFYANYNAFTSEGNINVVPITSNIDENFALPSISAFEEKITSKTKAILICNPNNPTGYVYSKEELLQLKEIVLKHNLFIIVDEVYREFVYEGEQHTSILSLTGLEQHAILVDSISKRYSSCGARIGCLVSKNKEFIANVMKFAQARLCPPYLEQEFASASSKVPDSYFKEVTTEYKKRRDFVVNGLQQIEGVKCAQPKGAFYCIAELPVDDAEVFCKWLLSDFSYQGQTVMLAPAKGFYMSPKIGQKQVRLAYVLNTEKLEQALLCLQEGLKQYNSLQ